MTRPDIDKLVRDVYLDPSVPSHALRAIDTFVRYIQHLEHELDFTEPYDAPAKIAKLKLEKQFDPRNVPEFLDIVRKQHDKD
ncbi:MAG: hypothetical protein WC444_05000 [Candidatus Paceibacterota bacterium]